MILAKIKSAVLACGLIATGAFVVAQQVGTAMPERKAQDASASVPDHRSAPPAHLTKTTWWQGSWANWTSISWPTRCNSSGNKSRLAIRDKLRAGDKLRRYEGRASAFEAARASYLAKAPSCMPLGVVSPMPRNRGFRSSNRRASRRPRSSWRPRRCPPARTAPARRGHRLDQSGCCLQAIRESRGVEQRIGAVPVPKE